MPLIDARTLAAEPSGIGVYTLNLLRGIVAAGPDAPVSVWVRPEVARRLPAALQASDALRLIERAGSPAHPRNLFLGGRAAARAAAGATGDGGPGVLHVPDILAPLCGAFRPVVTLHDVIPLVCRGELARSKKQRLIALWRALAVRQTRRAAAVVTVSAYSAHDITRVLGVPREKIVVIHNAVTSSAPEAAAEGANGGRYVLNVGRRDPYKNVPGLVRAFARMRAADPKLADVRLVVVGPRDPRYPEAETEARRLGLGDAVEFVGYVEHNALAALYRDATVVAVPSRYEGFGLPLAEAMAAGTPVVCSDRSSLPEVAGGAALLVDPDDEPAMAAALGRVLNDGGLAADLGRRGRERAAAFSLRAFGERHLALYARMAAGDV